MARPQKEDILKKSRKIDFRLDETEYDIIESRAVQAGMTVSEFVRHQAIHGKCTVCYSLCADNDELRQILVELRAIGNKTICYVQENGFDTRDDINARLEEIRCKLQDAQQTFHDTENRIQMLNEQIHYVGQYTSHKAVKAEFLKAKNKKQFREQHGTELDLYETAVKYIKTNMNAQVPLLNELKAQRDQLLQMKKAQRGTCEYFKEYEKELRTACANVDAILEGTAAQNTQVAETVLPSKSPERASVLERLRNNQQIVEAYKQGTPARKKSDPQR